MLYSFGGMLVDIIGKNTFVKERCRGFEVQLVPTTEIDMVFRMQEETLIPIPEGRIVFREFETVLLEKDGGKGCYFLYSDTDLNKRNEGKELALLLDVEDDWRTVLVRHLANETLIRPVELESSVEWAEYHMFMIMGLAVRNRLIAKNGLAIHCSAISYEGSGILFSAPSGTGKSTHTRMWKQLYGDMVTIVNDDRPAVRLINDKAFLAGLPWSGSSSLFTNDVVPLRHIVMLERGERNKIRRLSPFDALQWLLPRCFLPYSDSRMMEMALTTLEVLLDQVPVSLLTCRPDAEAVELVRSCLV